MRRSLFLTFIIFSLSLVTSSTILAVGGGGGGSVPSCTEDKWDCTEWSSCSTDGKQVRTCTLTFDCSDATTPKPTEEQSCTPPSPPPLPSPPPSTIQIQQTQEIPKPVEKKATPVCAADKWECGKWSSSCNILGQHTRTCKLISDCLAVATPPPATKKACEKLQCGDEPNLRDRIACRLNLAPEGLTRELEIQYLPEECRALKDKSEQNKCIALYRSYQPCWNVTAGEGRFSCARNVLKLGPVLSEEVKTCQGKTGQEQVACKEAVKEKVFLMIKFRLYDLEERAEELAEEGKADINDVADFVALVEQRKQAFDNAKTKEERREIILDVRAAWQEFIKKVK